MKFYLVKMLTNTQGQDAPSIDVYPTKERALVAWHNILAAYHNAPDVLHAVVEIINELGGIEKVEIVDHTPEPEPEPEPIIEETPEVVEENEVEPEPEIITEPEEE